MSTHCLIFITNRDLDLNEYSYHYDGGPEGIGKMLLLVEPEKRCNIEHLKYVMESRKWGRPSEISFNRGCADVSDFRNSMTEWNYLVSENGRIFVRNGFHHVNIERSFYTVTEWETMVNSYKESVGIR